MEQLKKRRLAIGLTQKQVAEKCGIEQGYYSAIENNRRKPSVKLAKKLACLMQIDWTEFFKEWKEMQTNALKVKKLNTVNICPGDRVECKITGNKGIETKIIVGNVIEIDKKGRWFRVETDDGWFHCHLFAAMEYGKSTYRILRRKEC